MSPKKAALNQSHNKPPPQKNDDLENLSYLKPYNVVEPFGERNTEIQNVFKNQRIQSASLQKNGSPKKRSHSTSVVRPRCQIDLSNMKKAANLVEKLQLTTKS